MLDLHAIGKAVRDEITESRDVSHCHECSDSEYVDVVEGQDVEVGAGVIRALERIGYKVTKA